MRDVRDANRGMREHDANGNVGKEGTKSPDAFGTDGTKVCEVPDAADAEDRVTGSPGTNLGKMGQKVLKNLTVK
ncbi:hypothetical protein KI387_038212, partial [Taxus chinensis]